MLIVQATGISDEEEMWRQSQSSHSLIISFSQTLFP
jgi:hypothetical protein